MKHATVTLEDKYRVGIHRVYLTGTQALVRLPLLQRSLDVAAGLNTAGFVSGYRGSPLGQIDIALWDARPYLDAHHIHFQPGVNEDLAATAVWGTQQVPLLRGARYDGVFAYWYGKGPGVDRSGDAFKHANFAGTARTGGVLLVAGDDHACKSSTVPHQSEPALAAASIPVLVPADVRDILELGLHGWAMSRWSGRYIGLKTVADVVESSASIVFDLAAFHIRPPGPLHPDTNIRVPDTPLQQEARLMGLGLPAAQDYARANGLDRLVIPGERARLGIVTAGRCYHDTWRMMTDLGLDGQVRLLKLALTWPVDPATIRRFAYGLDEILVVEDKAPFIETQIRSILYNLVSRPRIVGKYDENGAILLKQTAELSAAEIALAVAKRVGRYAETERLRARRLALEQELLRLDRTEIVAQRRPYFCSGCPHNTSTKVIDGSRALAGIGCHYMVLWMDRQTDTFSQMGGEGVAWIGQAPFTEENHVFANLGDGTYVHSGSMAIRAAVVAGVNITYKLLFNDAVAMTGGQPAEGAMTVPQITRQLAAEGVARIAVVAEEPERHAAAADFADGVTLHPRADLQAVERQFRDLPGVTVIIYDQVCASEKRRRRKRGRMTEPTRRAFINAAVCEGCGDCSRTSNCLSVQPLETEFGTKRQIDQTTCNKDFTCVDGFCPSFVTVHGGTLRKPTRVTPDDLALPQPRLADLDRPWNILVAGIGGTGIVTVGALLGMAAHAQGLQVSVLDQLGLAQKGGGVVSHIRLASRPDDLHGVRLGLGEADVLLAADSVVAAGRDTLAALRPDRAHVVLNTHATPTADFVLDRDAHLPAGRLRAAITAAAGAAAIDALDATAIATALMGHAVGANLLLMGYAWQKGLIPLQLDNLLHAIELNGVAVAANKDAFAWGRAAALDLSRVLAAAGIAAKPAVPPSLEETIHRRFDHLVAYQGLGYARRYDAVVERVREAEAAAIPGSTVLTVAVARNLHKLMAIKDEYEIARLYTAPEFRAALDAQFQDIERLEFHLAPPLLARRDPQTGHLRKRAYGPRMLGLFRVLAALRRLRGTRLDIFARTDERRAEYAVLAEYEATVDDLLTHLSPATLPICVALASLPDRIRGFGHVKERAMREAAAERARLLERLHPAAEEKLAAD